jgi:hypothetical protein
MVFHHLNTEEKDFAISDGNIRSFEKIKSELDKCILLCSNCHAEIHDNLWKEQNNKKQEEFKNLKIIS